jgi:hypothetical protein
MPTPEMKQRSPSPPEPMRKPRKIKPEPATQSKTLVLKSPKCKLCDNEDAEDFEKGCRSLCMNCKADFQAFKKRNREKTVRFSACKLMMEQLTKTRADDVVLYSEISTLALDKLAKDTRGIISRLERIEKKLGIQHEEWVNQPPVCITNWVD